MPYGIIQSILFFFSGSKPWRKGGSGLPLALILVAGAEQDCGSIFGGKGALVPNLPLAQGFLVGGAVQFAEILFHFFPKVIALHYFCPSAPDTFRGRGRRGNAPASADGV